MNVTERAAKLGFPTLSDPGITVDPAAVRLLAPDAGAVGVAVAGGVLEVVTDHIPTGAELSAWERTSGCDVTVRIAEPHHYAHLAQTSPRSGGRVIGDLLSATSDAVHTVWLHVGQPPLAGTAQGVAEIPWPAMTRSDVDAAVSYLLGDQEHGTITWAKRRWSFNSARTNGAPALVLKRLPNTDIPLSGLDLPTDTSRIPALTSGLVLIASGHGHGRTTTLTALTDRIVATRPDLVAAISTSTGPLVRSNGTKVRIVLGVDAATTAEAVSHAHALGATVITVDAATWTHADVSAVLAASASGVLVLAAVPGSGVPAAVANILSEVPDTHRDGVLAQLAAGYQVGLAQELLVGTGGKRAVAAALWWTTPGIVAALKAGDLNKLEAAATSGVGKATNSTMRRAVSALADTGRISAETAAARTGTLPGVAVGTGGDVPAGWDAQNPDDPSPASAHRAAAPATAGKRRAPGLPAAAPGPNSRLDEQLER
jgi:Tfp pilus assembly pilus retraction ATPase PilT